MIYMAKEVVLTGLRSNAEFHIGNYLGAILPMVEMQRKHAGQYQLNMFIPDLHSITTAVEYGKLYEQTMENLKVFLAAGLDIEQPDTFIYRQSYIPAHSEMTWILSCFAYFGELGRMTEFKNKAGIMVQHAKSRHVMRTTVYEAADVPDDLDEYVNVSAGLFLYPVLMAADILLYDAKWVPVGEDQRQHLELARDLATRINNKFGELFTVPHDWNKQLEFAGLERGVRIRSLRNPEKKMSKSIEDPAGTIMLSDSPEDGAKKVMEATTDSMGIVNYDWEKQPGVTNLLEILALLTDRHHEDVAKEWQGQTSYSELKSSVAKEVKKLLGGLQEKLSAVDEAKLLQKLEKDEATMRKVADERLVKVQRAVGLRPSSP